MPGSIGRNGDRQPKKSPGSPGLFASSAPRLEVVQAATGPVLEEQMIRGRQLLVEPRSERP